MWYKNWLMATKIAVSSVIIFRTWSLLFPPPFAFPSPIWVHRLLRLGWEPLELPGYSPSSESWDFPFYLLCVYLPQPARGHSSLATQKLLNQQFCTFYSGSNCKGHSLFSFSGDISPVWDFPLKKNLTKSRLGLNKLVQSFGRRVVVGVKLS